MVLAALDGMKSALSAEINKVNACVDQLILNPSGIVPSSQPHQDYGNFSLPTTADHQEFGDWTQAPDDPSDPLFDQMMADDECAQEALFFDLAKILYTLGRCRPFSEDNHLLFVEFLHRLLKELGWALTPTTFSPEQLNHIGTHWNAHLTEEVETAKHFQDIDLFDDLFSHNAPWSTEDLARFSANIDRFCAHYKKRRPLPESDFIFIKEFLTCPVDLTRPADPQTSKPTTRPPGPKVRFSEPPP
jgi:hypothetical protein